MNEKSISEMNEIIQKALILLELLEEYKMLEQSEKEALIGIRNKAYGAKKIQIMQSTLNVNEATHE